MSVPNQTPYIVYNANGLTTVFPFEFYIINAGDIQVSLNGDVLATGYSVSGVGNVGGGNVTFLTPPANGTVVMLERVVPTYRLTDYQDNGDLLADTVNKDFDRLWMAIQRSFIYLGLALRRPLLGGPYNAEGYRISNLADPVNDQDAATKKYVHEQGALNLNKTLRVPEASTPVLPTAAGRANKLLGFNSAGDPVMVLPQSGSASDVLLELAAEDGDKYIGECQTVARLRHIEPERDGQRITLRQHTAGTGYGGGQFRARLDGAAYTDNNGTIIKTAGGAVWLRINADVITPLMFGAIPDGVTDCSTAFTNALSAGSVYVPDGTFWIKDINVPNETSINGNGHKSKLYVAPGNKGLIIGPDIISPDPDDVPQGCHVRNVHFASDSVSDGTVGIQLRWISSSIFENIYYTKLDKVIQQDHAEGCQFINISNSDIEEGDTDCNYTIYANVKIRSNDNIYKNCICRANLFEFYLGVQNPSDWTQQHDGAQFVDNIIFGGQYDGVYLAHCIHSSVTNNRFFGHGRNSLSIAVACQNTNIIGNEFLWSGTRTPGGASAVLITTSAGSYASAVGQCDIGNNTMVCPSGHGIQINGLSNFNLHNNTIVSPNNVRNTPSGFVAKSYDGIRIGANCTYFSVYDNLVTTGINGRGGDDFSTNWRFDVYIDSLALYGTVTHETINVRNISPYVSVSLPHIPKITKHLTAKKEINSPYSVSGWSVSSGSPTIAMASATNPYDEEASNSVLQMVNTSGDGSIVQGQGSASSGDAVGATFMVRCVGVTSAWVRFVIHVGGNIFLWRSIMINDGWNEIDMRRDGVGAGAITFTIGTSDACTIQMAELRVTKTRRSPQTSGNYYGTSAPVSGYWKVGDRVLNSGPVVGSAKAWVCTASGVPGTWVSEGNL